MPGGGAARRGSVRRNRLWLIFIVAAAAAVLTFAVQWGAGAEDVSLRELRTVLEVISLVKTQYVDPVDSLALISGYLSTGSVNGMLEEVLGDGYTRHMDRAAYRQMQADTSGEFSGIGIVVGIRDGRITIISPIEDTPGFHAGLQGGDVIVSIDGRSTEGMFLDEAVSLMRGERHTEVQLGIDRNGEAFEVTVTRDDIVVRSVSRVEVVEPSPDFPFLTDRVGYIRLSNFSERTSHELEEALLDLEAAGVRGIALDLRNNPGGLLTAALQAADKFIPDGPLVHIVGRGDARRTYHASGPTHPRLPMVVLVNQFSASASEILAGALRDRGIAVLVGETTFGKGLVQTIFGLSDGGLSLTSARFETAGGHAIHEVGIEPDVVVRLDEQEAAELYDIVRFGSVSPEDPQLTRALQELQFQVTSSDFATRQAG